MTYPTTIYHIGAVTNLVVMDDCQRLNSKRRGIQVSVMKLTTKVEDMLSADLAGVSTQTVPEGKKLLAETTLAQLKHKKEQISELEMW